MDLIQTKFNEKQYNIAYLLSKIYKENTGKNNELFTQILPNIDKDIIVNNENSLINNNSKIKVLLCCNWLSSKDICDLWNIMSKGDYTWNNIKIVWEEPCDYYCIINCPPSNIKIDFSRTILFRMEPYMEKNLSWKEEWRDPNDENFLFVGNHKNHFNNNEWHLSKSYTELSTEKINKDNNMNNILSTILSNKYNDPGHIKRVDFIKFIERKGLHVDVYGGNRFLWKNFKGELPYHEKDNGLMPYKYTFNCENFNIKNYYTEKLIDGILCECLVFYSGCPNIKELINEKAFIYLELSNFEKDYDIIQKAIKDDLWSERLPYIKAEKERILNELQFFPRIEKIIKDYENKQNKDKIL